MLLVSACGLAASGVTSYLVQRQSVLTAIDDKLLRIVDDVQAIAAGETSGDTPGTADGTADGTRRDRFGGRPLTSVEQVLEVAMRQLVLSANESTQGFVAGSATRTGTTVPPFRLTDSPELVDRLLSEASTRSIVLGTAHIGAEPASTTDASTTDATTTDAQTTDARSGRESFPATVRYIIIPVTVRGDARSGLYVAAFDVDAELAAVTHSLDTYARVALGALVLVGLVAWLVAGRLLRPIRLLRDAAIASTSAGPPVEKIPVTGRDDVSNLTEAMNDMFDRLHGASLSQQRLLDDVGHELKTPITIIRGQLEVLDAGHQAEVEATRALAIEELDRMVSLLAGISLLAQSRAPHFVERAPLQLAAFTAAVGAKARALDPARQWSVLGPDADAASGMTTTAAAAAPAVVSVDADRITQAWLQLAANAARHSTRGGPIALRSVITMGRPAGFTHSVVCLPPLGSTGGLPGAGRPTRPTGASGPAGTAGTAVAPEGRWLCLSVRDAGPGIRLEAQPRIFDRFGRVENTRGAEGSGLGLSIVAAIAHAHGGTVLLDSAAGSGSTFTIVIPADLVDEADRPHRAGLPSAPVQQSTGTITATRSTP